EHNSASPDEVRGGGEFLLKSYRVIYDGGEVRVGAEPFRAEIRRRVDATTLVDGWLGQMHDHADGVVVLLDRVVAFALDQVWPALDPALDRELDPVTRAFAPSLRAELAAGLSAPELAALRATAEDRYWMNRAATAIHGRHQCGSAFWVSRIPWNGLSPRDLATLRQHAETAGDAACPDVTPDEALVFAVRSGRIRQVPGVREALEHLVGFVANAVVIHEARHAADDRALAGQPIPCIGCPPETSHRSAFEGSAYAASFADPVHGALAMYQACALDPAFVPEEAGIVAFLASGLTPGGCADGAPADLAARARAVEREVFRRDDRIEVVDFPASLPVGVP
ncbi:MAG: hypothetical protein ABMB14_41300, partial [Myxococcota bacterium]